MFTAFRIYAESFEKPFLESTFEFYAVEGMKYMQQSDVPDYLKHVETRLQEEHERCLIYLDASTRKPLIATAEKQLLERHIPAILDKGFSMLMDGNCVDDLQRLYSLFLRVNALESLRQALSSYIRRTGQGIVLDEEKDKDMVSSLLEFKASLDRIWEESFFKNEAFVTPLKKHLSILSIYGRVIQGSGLSGPIPSGISHLRNLTDLNLSSLNLGGEISPAIGDLRNLQSVDLSDNQLYGDIPFSISKPKQLEFLNLKRNQLIGPIPSTLSQIPNLKTLIF